MLATLLLALLSTAQAAPSLPEKAEQTVAAFRKAKNAKEWIETAPGLSPFERRGLLGDKRLQGTLPKIQLRKRNPGRVWLSVNGAEFDFSYLRQGKILYQGKTIPVPKDVFLPELAQKVAEAMGASQKSHALSLPWILPPEAFAGSLMRGCATKDLFTLPDIFNSPFGYMPPVWVSAAAISIIRWGGDQFRDCDRQVDDLRRLLARHKVAIKSLNCGTDQWGSDREVEFWTTEEKDGKPVAEKYNLDYVNYFAEEVNEDGSSKRLYVFGENRLNEIRVLRNSNADFQGDCHVLNYQSKGKDIEEFVALREKMERYRKALFYIGEYNSCTACREIETKITSAKPPAYLTGEGAKVVEKLKAAKKSGRIKKAAPTDPNSATAQ